MDSIDKINFILKERGMTGAELSRRIGVSTAVYSQWNKKKTKPSNKSILKIAGVFEVPVWELFGDDDEQKEKPVTESDELEKYMDEFRPLLGQISSEQREAVLQFLKTFLDNK